MDGGPTGRIPMVVLGGWLGAGKTTLVNRLLRAAHDERIAVVVNDIGEVNLDAELVAARDGDTVELTNGCVCCSMGESLALTLRDLVLAERPPDRLVVEASGGAGSGRTAWWWPSMLRTSYSGPPIRPTDRWSAARPPRPTSSW